MGYVPRKNVFRKMEEIWDIIIVIYWVLMGGSLLMIIVKLIIPHYLFSIDDVTKNKAEVFQSVLNVIEGDLGIQVKGLSIKYDYTKNDELKGYWIWAIPVAKKMKTNKLLTKFWHHIMKYKIQQQDKSSIIISIFFVTYSTCRKAP